MERRALVALAAALLLGAVGIAVSGGLVVSAGGVRVSARSPQAAALAGTALALAWLALAARAHAVASDLTAVSRALENRDRALVALLAIGVATVAVGWGTYSPAGADASGYLSQAAMWSRFEWRLADGLAVSEGWPLQPLDTTPLGWRPALDAGWQVPTYPPGLPLLMAVPFRLAGTTGAALVVAACAALAVVATAGVARVLGGGLAAVVAAALLSSSPTFLYQSLQPMSDVPVTAAWLACWWAVLSGRPRLAGVAAAAAVLVRPNLAPLAVLPLVNVFGSGDRPARVRDALGYLVPVALAGVAIAGLQWRWYGSPVTSGYGSPGELFAAANIVPNLRLYAGWIGEGEAALAHVVLLTTVLTVVRTMVRDRAPVRLPVRTLLALSAFSLLLLLSYLLYAQFERWSYLRFLLPALAVAMALTGTVAASLLERVPAVARGMVLLVAVTAILAGGITTARRLEVFQISRLHARAVEAGAALRGALPPHAVLFAGEQSGSMRHETGRPVVRWESLTAEEFGAVLAALDRQGLEAWWVLDQWEESLVRQRLGAVPQALLDWPPAVEGGPLMRTRAWRMADRR